MIYDHDVTQVFGHGAPLAREAASILRRSVTAAVDIPAIGHVFRIRVGDGPGQPGRVSLFHFHHQREVYRGSVVRAVRYIGNGGINRIEGPSRTLSARPWKRLVVIVIGNETGTAGPDVRHIQ